MLRYKPSFFNMKEDDNGEFVHYTDYNNELTSREFLEKQSKDRLNIIFEHNQKIALLKSSLNSTTAENDRLEQKLNLYNMILTSVVSVGVAVVLLYTVVNYGGTMNVLFN